VGSDPAPGYERRDRKRTHHSRLMRSDLRDAVFDLRAGLSRLIQGGNSTNSRGLQKTEPDY